MSFITLFVVSVSVGFAGDRTTRETAEISGTEDTEQVDHRGGLAKVTETRAVARSLQTRAEERQNKDATKCLTHKITTLDMLEMVVTRANLSIEAALEEDDDRRIDREMKRIIDAKQQAEDLYAESHRCLR